MALGRFMYNPGFQPNGGIAGRLKAGGSAGRVQPIRAVRISLVRLLHLRIAPPARRS